MKNLELAQMTIALLENLATQIEQENYPFDLERLNAHIRAGSEGRFNDFNRSWVIWKDLKVFTGKNKSQKILADIEKYGCVYITWAKSIIEGPFWPNKKGVVELNLVRTKVMDFALPEGGSVDEVFCRAKSQGLILGPPEEAPKLRVKYLDQPKGEKLLVATTAVRDFAESECYFMLEHNDKGLVLSVRSLEPSTILSPDTEIVFVRK